MSYSQYCGYWGHITGGHRCLYRDYIRASTNVLIRDACPVGLPMSVARVFQVSCATNAGA